MSSQGLAGDRVTVFAAASLKGALDEAVTLYSADVAVSYAGSGLIARQVVQGAPADLVILASADWMAWMIAASPRKLIKREDFLSNRLVLIGPADAPPLPGVTAAGLIARLQGGRLATGMTDSVPAGIYARQWLEAAGLWTGLRPHLAETDNVRVALALVARGEAPLGLVYASDAMAESDVRVLYEIPPEMHDAIVYPMAVFDGRTVEEASDLAVFLTSEAAVDIFARHGFLPIGFRP